MNDFPSLFGCARGSAGKVIVIGVPYDRGTSSDRAGCSMGPMTLRQASLPELTRMDVHGLYDYASQKLRIPPGAISDIGDLRFSPEQHDDAYLAFVERAVRLIAQERKLPFALGGDHLITLAALRGVAAVAGVIQLIQLDAHHDNAPVQRDERPTHASFISQAISEKLVSRVIQLGVRGFACGKPSLQPELRLATEDSLAGMLEPGVPTYVTVDSDAFCPTLIPGVSYPEPRGMTLSSLDRILATVRACNVRLIGADWTEYNPRFDTQHQLGAKTVLSGIVAVLETLLAADKE